MRFWSGRQSRGPHVTDVTYNVWPALEITRFSCTRGAYGFAEIGYHISMVADLCTKTIVVMDAWP